MIKEYIEKYFNSVNVLGREISSTYTFSKSNVGVCYVYELDDEIVGFINADIFDDRAEIIDLAVLPLYRNRKIGSFMLKYLIDFLDDEDIKYLNPLRNNLPIIASQSGITSSSPRIYLRIVVIT